MISLAKRTLQIFAGLSVGSTIPLTSSLLGRKEEIRLPRKGNRQMSVDHREETREVQEVPESAMQQAVKKMERDGKTGQKGCFWLFENRNIMEFFMCVDLEALGVPTLFHYARNDRTIPRDQKLNEVTEITKNGTSSWKMTFDNNRTKEIPRYLSIAFSWLSKWNANLMPKNHCKVERSDSTKKLTCDNPSKKFGENAFTKTVSPEPPHKSED